MKITRQQLRKLIFEAQKDKDDYAELDRNISARIKDIEKEFPGVSPTAERQSLPSDIGQRKVTAARRDYKKFWNERADHSFFQDPNKFICVHWVGRHREKNPITGEYSIATGIFNKFFKSAQPNTKNRFELSTHGYTSMSAIGKQQSFFGREFGFVLNPRRVTYAANTDIKSEGGGIGTFSDAAEREESQISSDFFRNFRKNNPREKWDDAGYEYEKMMRKKYFGSSGTARRPSYLVDPNKVVFDEEDVKKAIKEPGYHGGPGGMIYEVICDNWTPSIFVFKESEEEFVENLYLEFDELKKYGVRYYAYDIGMYYDSRDDFPDTIVKRMQPKLNKIKQQQLIDVADDDEVVAILEGLLKNITG